MVNRNAAAGTLPVARPVSSWATAFFAILCLAVVVGAAIASNLTRPDSSNEAVPGIVLTPMDDYGIRHPDGSLLSRPSSVALTPMDDYGIRHPDGGLLAG